MRLIEGTHSFEILRDGTLGLRVTLEGFVTRGHVPVGATSINRFTEPVRCLATEAAPGGDLESDARRVEVGVGRVSGLPQFVIARIGTALGNGAGGLRYTGRRDGAIGEAHHK